MLFLGSRVLSKSHHLCKRAYSSSAIPGLIKKLDTDDKINDFFNHTSWSTSELLEQEGNPVLLNNEVLHNILDLSGLSKDLSESRRKELLSLLERQLNFITKLHDVELHKAYSVTRLVDDNGVKPLDYETLTEEISEAAASLSKGEIESSWNPLSLATQYEGKYFLVKEGLLKNTR